MKTLMEMIWIDKLNEKKYGKLYFIDNMRLRWREINDFVKCLLGLE